MESIQAMEVSITITVQYIQDYQQDLDHLHPYTNLQHPPGKHSIIVTVIEIHFCKSMNGSSFDSLSPRAGFFSIGTHKLLK